MRGVIAALGFGVVVCACAAPFDVGAPTTRALEQAAADSLSATSSFEVTGTYLEGTAPLRTDLQVTRGGALRIVFNAGTPNQLEAIIDGGQSYFRGQRYLASHLGSDPASQSLAAAAGTSWWKSAIASVPAMPDFLDGAAFRAAFLGSAVRSRTDHVTIDGADTVDLSGPRADVYIGETSPHRLVHLRMKSGVMVDGIYGADFHYGAYDRDFGIQPPADVIDFSNLSTLPPVYTVVSVDTSACASPCVVSAQVMNLGGERGAAGPSTVTFTMSDAATGAVLARCETGVVPDVGYNETTTVTCTMSATAGAPNAAIVTATAQNPGRG